MKELLNEWRKYLAEQKDTKALLKEQDYKVYKTQKGDTMRRLFGLGASFDRKDPLGQHNFTNINLALRDAGMPRYLRDEEAKFDHPLGVGFEIRLPMTSNVPDEKPKEEEKSYKGLGFPGAQDEYLDLVDLYDQVTVGATDYGRAGRDKRDARMGRWRAIVTQTPPASYMKKMSGEAKWLWKSLQKKYGDSIKIGFLVAPADPNDPQSTGESNLVTGASLTGEPEDAKIYLYPIIIRNKRPVVWTPSGEKPLRADVATKIHPIAY